MQVVQVVQVVKVEALMKEGYNVPHTPTTSLPCSLAPPYPALGGT